MPGFDNTADAERLPAGRQNGPGPGTAAPAAGGVHARLLLLQRLAGNRAVQSMLRPAPGAIVVQRDDVVPGQTDLGDLVDGVAEITEGVSFMDISDDGDGEGAGAVEGGGDAPNPFGFGGPSPTPFAPTSPFGSSRPFSPFSPFGSSLPSSPSGFPPSSSSGFGTPPSSSGFGAPPPTPWWAQTPTPSPPPGSGAGGPSPFGPPSTFGVPPFGPSTSSPSPFGGTPTPSPFGLSSPTSSPTPNPFGLPSHKPRFGEPSTLGWSSPPPPQSQTSFPSFGTGSWGSEPLYSFSSPPPGQWGSGWPVQKADEDLPVQRSLSGGPITVQRIGAGNVYNVTGTDGIPRQFTTGPGGYVDFDVPWQPGDGPALAVHKDVQIDDPANPTKLLLQPAYQYANVKTRPPLKNKRSWHFMAANWAAFGTTGKGSPAPDTWHHHKDKGRMQLIDASVHGNVPHNGGHSTWGKR